MSTFRLPDLGEGLSEAEITAWHVEPGDVVKTGDTLVAVETDKAVVEIPSPESGTVAKCFGAVGDHIAVGAPLVAFADGTPSGRAPALVGRLPTGPKPPAAATGDPAIKAAPAIRAEARRRGVDLATVTVTGPDCLVTMADLDEASAGDASHALAEPLRGPRRAMARNMTRARDKVAAATVTDEAVVGHWTETTDVTVALVRAIVAAARAAPALNAWLDGPSFSRTLHRTVDLGIAMDTTDGLFVPVVRRAETLDDAALRGELDRLKTAVRQRTITPAELARPTLTLSNFGLLGGRFAALTLIPPQVAILGAGRAREAVVPEAGKPAIRRVLPLSLTFDHRAVTGGEAARFLATVIQTLEQQPESP
jgi:2-oxoisovalerate dehydrogenase E2 component (dihydrolipoyl transacylase)